MNNKQTKQCTVKLATNLLLAIHGAGTVWFIILFPSNNLRKNVELFRFIDLMMMVGEGGMTLQNLKQDEKGSFLSWKIKSFPRPQNFDCFFNTFINHCFVYKFGYAQQYHCKLKF